MNTVVMIAYYFPPDGSAGVYRPLRFVRQLPARGWLPSVVTVRADGHARYDPHLMDSVPKEIELVRVVHSDLWQAFQTRRAKRLQARIDRGSAGEWAKVERAHQQPVRRLARRLVRTVEASVYYPDLARFWIRPAVAATVELCQQKRPRAMFVTGGPWSAFLVAHKAWQRTGVPFVLDFRDSWTLTCNDEFEALRPRWAVRQDRRHLHRLLSDAQAVIFRYDAEAECYWQAYPGALKRSKIHIIPNGYEGPIERFDAPADDRCTILYAGTVVPYRYDTFLDAVTLLQQHYPSEARSLRVLFVGEGVEHVEQAAASRGLTAIVETMKPVPSREVERLQRDAHALLLLGVKPYQGYELCGSKVFGYLKAGRPIVGVLPCDESEKVLRRVGVSTISNVDSPREILNTLRDVLACWSTGQLSSLLPNPDACQSYSSEHQTSFVVRALEGLPPLVPFVPGRVEIPESLKAKIGPDGWIDTN